MLKSKINLFCEFSKSNGIKEKINEPKLPDIVLLGLIFVNFFPPIVLPAIYPPISELVQINKIKI